MTTRAILWCGQKRRPNIRLDEFGEGDRARRSWPTRAREAGEDLALPSDDQKIQELSLDLAFQGALALGISADDVHACVLDHDLLPQHFRTDPHRATVDDLRRLAAALAKNAAPDDALLFIAVNHGAEDGLLTSEPPLDEFDEKRTPPRLTPTALDECLRPLLGPQIIIVATCYAGVFLGLGRDGRVVLASCARDQEYYVPRQDHAWPAFLDQLLGAWCGFAFADTIQKMRLDIDEAFTRARDQLVAINAPNLPQRRGTVVWPRSPTRK